MKKGTVIILLLLVLAVFAVILWSADLVSMHFGKAGEIIALSAVAVVLLIAYMKTKGEK